MRHLNLYHVRREHLSDGSIPHDALSMVEAIRPQLAAENERTFQFRMIPIQGRAYDSRKERVLELVGKRLKLETERLLRRKQRWSEKGGLVLHVEIEH